MAPYVIYCPVDSVRCIISLKVLAVVIGVVDRLDLDLHIYVRVVVEVVAIYTIAVCIIVVSSLVAVVVIMIVCVSVQYTHARIYCGGFGRVSSRRLAVVVWLGCCVVYRLCAIVRLVGNTASLYPVVEAGRYCGSAAASGSDERMGIQVDGLTTGCVMHA